MLKAKVIYLRGKRILADANDILTFFEDFFLLLLFLFIYGDENYVQLKNKFRSS